MDQIRRVLLLGAAMGGIAGPSAAQAAAVVLTVRNEGGQRRQFDMAALERMPQRSMVTATPWYDHPRKFTGPLLRDVLAAAGAKGGTLTAVALNDYKVELPADDASKFDVVMARLMDDEPMPIRDKGPLFIVYPFDSQSLLRSERYYSRSAWQLRTLDVK